MSMTYTTFVQRAVELGALSEQTVNFAAVIPAAIDYAEQRCYRELGLLEVTVRDSTTNATANSRNFTLPVPATGRFTVVKGINFVTPVGQVVANGTLNPVTPASVEWIKYCWPSNTSPSASTVPECFAMLTDQEIIFGPAPGAAFNVQVIGEIRPNPLSASNPSTILTLYFPDLFLAAAMVHFSTYGNQGGVNAAQAETWNKAYEVAKGSADVEEGRKRFAGASWTSHKVEPGAVPQRG